MKNLGVIVIEFDPGAVAMEVGKVGDETGKELGRQIMLNSAGSPSAFHKKKNSDNPEPNVHCGAEQKHDFLDPMIQVGVVIFVSESVDHNNGDPYESQDETPGRED